MLETLAAFIHKTNSDIYFQTVVAPIIFKYEGTQYTNKKNDPGGPTKYGWTLRTYRQLIDKKANISTLQNLTEYDAMAYYRIYFWDKYGAAQLSNQKLSISLVLAQINLGPSRPNRIIQELANSYCDAHLRIDGVLGEYSIKSINNCPYIWPGFPYVLHYYYSHNPRILPIWQWASKGIRNRLFHGLMDDSELSKS